MKLLASLPLWLLHGLGKFLGVAVYFGVARYRQRLKANALLAGYQGFGFFCRTAAQAGAAILELPYVWLNSEKALTQVHTDDWSVVKQAQQQGRGIIFLTPHLGCWEVAARYYAERTAAEQPSMATTLTVLYRPPRKAWLARYLESTRATAILDTAPSNLSGVRKLLRALKRKESVGILPDQVPSQGEGVWAPFFGQPAFTMTLPLRLAQLSQAVIVLAYAQRLPWGRGWRLHFQPWQPPPDLLHPPSSQTEHFSLLAASACNQAMESLIRQAPTQYLWGYHRYKTPTSQTPTVNSLAESGK